MMKLYDVAMSLAHADQEIKLIDSKSRRICFEGTADELLDYSGLDYRKVSGLSIKNNKLVLEIK